MFRRLVHDGTVVSPRIAGEELVAASARQYDLDEARRETRDVIIGVTLTHPKIFEVPYQLRHDALHVARLQDHFVVLRFILVRQELRFTALVEAGLEPRCR